MSNRLTGESSPYLLQHQHNPVDWFPWGEEALEKARREEKPIFLSIGYAACHWCHVMERESFENEAIAEALNQDFVSIKVDREERPDLDHVYMAAVQAITQQGGGWPLSAFLAPDGKPFFGGTYWPPEPRYGRPGFGQVVARIADLWKNDRATLLDQGERVAEYLNRPPAGDGKATWEIRFAEDALSHMAESFDPEHGGFGSAPKFPHSMELDLALLAWHAGQNATSPDQRGADDAYGQLKTIVEKSLRSMAEGGIFDHVGGGFARYSVDQEWLVPHFEKMLYDNALLAKSYARAWQALEVPHFRDTAVRTLDFLLREMTHEEGGFFSSFDADSEGEEGKFYVWTKEEIQAVVEPDVFDAFCARYGVTERGNFEGKTILHERRPLDEVAAEFLFQPSVLRARFAEALGRLYAKRSERVRPGTDDKVLANWNGMALEALAVGYAAFGDERYRQAAEKNASFLLTQMRGSDGGLLHAWRNGVAKVPAFVDDYACVACGLVALYQATWDRQHLVSAVELVDRMLSDFQDEEQGGFFYAPKSGERMIARTKDFFDGSTPSGNSAAVHALVALGRLLGRDDYLEAARRAVDAGVPTMRRAPQATTNLMLAALALEKGEEWRLAADADSIDAQEFRVLWNRRYPGTAFVAALAEGDPLVDASIRDFLVRKENQPTLYRCRGRSCELPVVGWDAIRGALTE
ncbi:MAG TPA: thioredoxin domain-containing protein [Pirellulaceae bacterium]|jgi:hypothetical protein|nr:thioredoxin domain-containing protein [Pirellulaceae bacterium]